MVTLDRFLLPSTPISFHYQFHAEYGMIELGRVAKTVCVEEGNKNTLLSRTRLFEERYAAAESTYFIRFTNPFNKLEF